MKLVKHLLFAALVPLAACAADGAPTEETSTTTSEIVTAPTSFANPCDVGMTAVAWNTGDEIASATATGVHVILRRGDDSTGISGAVTQVNFYAFIIEDGTKLTHIYKVALESQYTFGLMMERTWVSRETPGSGRFHGVEGSVYGGKVPPLPPWPGGTQFTPGDTHALIGLGQSAMTVHIASDIQAYRAP